MHVVARLDPLAVWLFGSRAEGRSRPGSDYDLLVVVRDDTPEAELDPVRAWQRVRDINVPLDAVPCRWSDFVEERGEPGSLVHRVVALGRCVYERDA